MSRRLPSAIVRAASLLAPSDCRAEWVKEWQSELWYVPRHEAIQFCLGAFRDAVCLKRDHESTANRTRILLDSPLSCLAILALLAAASIVITVCLPLPHLLSPALTFRGFLVPCLRMLLLSCMFLPGTFTLWRRPARCHRTSWPSRLRRGIFLALKVALVQPIMLCGLLLQILIGPLGAIAGYVPFVLVLRWVISDQQQRCPVCLHSLTAPVRIGNPSRTFLEWYGAESACSHGHGLLHISENAFSYSRTPQWLDLDDSWSDLFAGQGKRHA